LQKEVVIPVYLGKEASIYSASSQAFCEKRVLEGLALLLAFSESTGPLVKRVHESSDIIFEFLLMAEAMRKAKRVLSF